MSAAKEGPANPEPGGRPAGGVGVFWDRQADRYNRPSRRGATHHQLTADRLEREMEGRILCVGGLWAAADLERVDGHISVVDLSRRMLSHYAEAGLAAVQADGRDLPLAPASFDHAVLPLMLHHVTGNPGDDATRLAQRVIRQTLDTLRPGGRIWIKEILVPPPVYLAEKLFSRVTRWFLGLAGIPLVIFHSEGTYRRFLERAGCEQIEVWASGSPRERWYDVIAPVIGLPWLRVPRFLIPVHYVLINARVPGPGEPASAAVNDPQNRQPP